jgi:hypothetical protein
MYNKQISKNCIHAFLIFAKHLIKVTHVGIMYKLQMYNVNGLFYRIIKSMYTNDRLCVRVDDKMTEFFMSGVGVKQSDVLSPSLFKIFINDLPSIIDDKTFNNSRW